MGIVEERIFDDGRPNYIMTENLRVPPQLWGLEMPLMSLGDHVSSQRINMFTTNIAQALIINGAEMPQVASGCEREYMKYTFNPTRFEQDGLVLMTIPKYRVNVGMDQIGYCPQYLVVYLGDEDKQVHCMWVSSYSQGTNGFGWENNINKAMMTPNTPVRKDSCIAHSRAVQGSKYCPGLNLNVCYGTFSETVEDAIAISESAAKRIVAKGYRTLTVDIHKDMVPLNRYGNDLHYKFMPDIGERVAEDGIVCGFRRVDDLTYFADMTPDALCKSQPIHDELFFQVDPGAQVIDIEVVMNPTKKVTTPPFVFNQVEKYRGETYAFYERVLQVYKQECVDKGREPGPEFSTMVTYAARYLRTIKRKVLGQTAKSQAKFKKKDTQIAFIQVKIVLKYNIAPSLGSKLTCRSANKGVVSVIVPDEHMPVNDYGVRADMLVSPMAIPNRMNPSQLYEVFISCLCDVVLKRMRAQPSLDAAYDMMLELFEDINPAYAKLIDTKVFPTKKEKLMFADTAIKSDYLIVVVPPFLDNVSPEWVLALRDKYRIRVTPVEYNKLDRKGKVIRKIRTKRNLFIGKKYVYLLCKVPFCKSSGLGFVNQWGVPITVKDTVTKSMTPISQTSIRLGEDETRNTMVNLGPAMASRLLGIYANAPEATGILADMLLEEHHPTRIQFIPKTNEFIQDHSRTIAAMHAIMNVCGIDLRESVATEKDMETLFLGEDNA